MTMRMEVFARTQFVAFHQWEGAPDWCKYLASPHRHLFKVEVGAHVDLSDREVEFHRLKRDTDQFIAVEWRVSIQSSLWSPVPIKDSCELMATRIGSFLRQSTQSVDKGYRVTYVEVSEDGECGGRVIYG